MTISQSDRETLIQKALDARKGSYSPYSKFRVGACLLAEDGTFVQGANVENASYGGAICAERTAVVKGVSEGKTKFVALAVASDLQEPISPCGICRQVLREFSPLNMPIYLLPAQYSKDTAFVSIADFEKAESKDVVITTSMAELLPVSFGPDDLDKPREKQ